MELAFEGHEDSIPNIIALLTKRQIFKNHDYQKYLIYYFIELGLRLEYYDLFFLSLSAKFFYKEQNYKKAIEKAYLEWIQGCIFAGYYDDKHKDISLDNFKDVTDFDLHAVYYTKHPEKWEKTPLIKYRKPYKYIEKNNH